MPNFRLQSKPFPWITLFDLNLFRFKMTPHPYYTPTSTLMGPTFRLCKTFYFLPGFIPLYSIFHPCSKSVLFRISRWKPDIILPKDLVMSISVTKCIDPIKMCWHNRHQLSPIMIWTLLEFNALNKRESGHFLALIFMAAENYFQKNTH